MDWSDDGIVLATRRHGESAAIVQLLTRAHGRHAGLVRGGRGAKARGVLQPGNRVAATWRARLAEHLGVYTCDLTHAHAAELMNDPLRLAGLSAACAIAEVALPEREPHGPLYDGFLALLDAFGGDHWPEVYVRWELGLLGELGYGLDLDRCAATGRKDALAYVSPKTGRAVSLSAGEPYRDKLLPLPGFLIGRPVPGPGEVPAGLRLTGYFLDKHVFTPRRENTGSGDSALPPARKRLAERLGGPVSAADPK